MQADIVDDVLTLVPQSPTEFYAINTWLKSSMGKKQAGDVIVIDNESFAMGVIANE